jgi:hypothetical protein
VEIYFPNKNTIYRVALANCIAGFYKVQRSNITSWLKKKFKEREYEI